MKKKTALVLLSVCGLMLAFGVLFLGISIVKPEISGVAWALVFGGAGVMWALVSWMRLDMISPEHLANSIVGDARLRDRFEMTTAEIVHDLRDLDVPAANVQEALEILVSRGEVVPEQRDEQRVYTFPNLKESKVERCCPYCGAQFPVKQALSKCPNCGGNLELERT